MDSQHFVTNVNDQTMKKVNSHFEVLMLIFLLNMLFSGCSNPKTSDTEIFELQCESSSLEQIENNQIKLYQVYPDEHFEEKTWPLQDITELTVLFQTEDKIPANLGLIKNLKALTLVGGNFAELPDEFGQLKELSNFRLINPGNIKELPRQLYELPKLSNLSVLYSHESFEFQEELCNVDFKLSLLATGTEVKDIPSCLKEKVVILKK